MKTPLRPLLVVLGCGLTVTAVAQPPRERSPAEMLKQADTDGDGTVSRDEFIKARTVRLEEAFTRLDADGSGALDAQEVEAAADQFRSLNPGGRGGFRRPEGPRPQRPNGPRPDGGRPGAGALGAEAFDQFDGDGDGRLTREEFEAGMARMREFMQQRNGPNGAGGLGRPAPPGGGPAEGFRRPPR